MKWKFRSHHHRLKWVHVVAFRQQYELQLSRKATTTTTQKIKWAQRQTQISITFCWSPDDTMVHLLPCQHTHSHSVDFSSDASVIVQINNDHNHVQHCDVDEKKNTCKEQEREGGWVRRACDFIFFRNGTTLRIRLMMIMAHYCLTRYTINFRSAFPTNSHHSMRCNPPLLLLYRCQCHKCMLNDAACVCVCAPTKAQSIF